MLVIESRIRTPRERAAMRGVRIVAGLFGLACLVASLGCSPEVHGIDAYPGSSIGPGHRMEKDGYLYLQQVYWTPDGYGDVVKFYEAYIAKEPGWEGGRRSEISSWKRNMEVPEMGAAYPLDPTISGGAIVVIQEPYRTVIRTYAAYPKTS